jgi:hypothetical protein
VDEVALIGTSRIPTLSQELEGAIRLHNVVDDSDARPFALLKPR